MKADWTDLAPGQVVVRLAIEMRSIKVSCSCVDPVRASVSMHLRQADSIHTRDHVHADRFSVADTVVDARARVRVNFLPEQFPVQLELLTSGVAPAT